jgi:hypothetical protein
LPKIVVETGIMVTARPIQMTERLAKYMAWYKITIRAAHHMANTNVHANDKPKK